MIKLILLIALFTLLLVAMAGCSTTGQERVHMWKPEKVYPTQASDKNVHHVPFKRIAETHAILGNEKI